MIQRLNSPVSFEANVSKSPRETYESLMTNNTQMAQKQTNVVQNLASAPKMGQVPMQGAGQKLDIIA